MSQTLQAYPDAVLATNAHNLRRCSGLSAGYSWVRERLGVARAEALRAQTDRVLAALVGRAELTPHLATAAVDAYTPALAPVPRIAIAWLQLPSNEEQPRAATCPSYLWRS